MANMYVPSAPMSYPGDSIQEAVLVRTTVEVVAPASLAGGYQFHVDAGAHQSLLVEVVRLGLAPIYLSTYTCLSSSVCPKNATPTNAN
jgi:hypothetical protein